MLPICTCQRSTTGPATARTSPRACQGRVTEHRALRDRRPRLGADAVLGVVFPHLSLGEQRVELDLVDRGDRVGLLGQPVEVGDREVGHPMLRALPSASSFSKPFQVST